METGTLNELYLTRSVIKHVRKHNKDITIGAGVGNDASCFKTGIRDFETGITKTETADEVSYIYETEAVSETPYIAWAKALNNMAAAGGRAVGVRIIAMLPLGYDEAFLKKSMAEFNMLADENKLQIMGGHTQFGRAYAYPSFVVSVSGVGYGYKSCIKDIKPQDDIVMTKYTGLMGSDIIARTRFGELRTRYAESYIKEAFVDKAQYIVTKEANLSCDSNLSVKYMHDVSHGGVYGALWQLGVASKHGIEVDNSLIPIKQETIEICEYYDINPYMLDGTGSLLIVSSKGEDLVKALKNVGIYAACIGKISQDKNRIINTKTERRFLAPVKGDEIYKVMKDGYTLFDISPN